jgi:hypothetical protein
MIKCDKIVLELNAYRKNIITPELKSEIDAHLKICDSCNKELKSQDKIDELLGYYQIDPVSSGFASGFFKRLENEEHKYAGRFRFNWRRVGLIASAALVLIAVALWVISPFSSTQNDTEIINHLELLEHLETVQIMDAVQDYELIETFPEILDVALNDY